MVAKHITAAPPKCVVVQEVEKPNCRTCLSRPARADHSSCASGPHGFGCAPTVDSQSSTKLASQAVSSLPQCVASEDKGRHAQLHHLAVPAWEAISGCAMLECGDLARIVSSVLSISGLAFLLLLWEVHISWCFCPRSGTPPLLDDKRF